jgi:hypothetical protein
MKSIGIYAGEFQPPHKGNYLIYKKLHMLVGPEVFVATTNHVRKPDQPLNFDEKEMIWVRHGVPSNRIVRVENIFRPIEITNMFDPSTTSIVFVVNSKDRHQIIGKESHDPRTGKTIYLKPNSNEPSYFQPFKDNRGHLEPLNKHGYIIVWDDTNIDGRPVNAQAIRKGMGSPQFTQKDKLIFFKWVFGWYDPSLFDVMKEKYTDAQKAEPEKSVEPEEEPQELVPTSAVKEVDMKTYLSSTMKEILATPQGTTTSTTLSTSTGTNPDLAAQSIPSTDSMTNRQAAEKQKTDLNKELDAKEKELKYKEKDARNLKSMTIPDMRKRIQTLNKAVASGTPVPPM